MSNIDSHGIKRGKCEADGCNCKEFVKGVSGPKCEGCKHVPTKHTEINPKPTSGATQTNLSQAQISAPLPQPITTTNQPIQPPIVHNIPQQPMYQSHVLNQSNMNYHPPMPQSSGFPPYNMQQPQSLNQDQQYFHQQQQQQFQEQQQQHHQQQQYMIGNVRCGLCGFFYPEVAGACLKCHPRDVCKICKRNPVFMDLSMSPELQKFVYCSPECRNTDLPNLDKEAGLLQDTS